MKSIYKLEFKYRDEEPMFFKTIRHAFEDLISEDETQLTDEQMKIILEKDYLITIEDTILT